MNGMLAERLGACRRVCFDSAAIIYFIEQHPAYYALLRPVFELVDSGNLEGFASTIALMEVLVRPLREHRLDLVDSYSQRLTRAKGFQVFPIDRHVARRGAQLRADHASLRPPDALQLATASLHEADAFLTNDRRLQSRGEVAVVVIDDFLTRDNEEPA